MPRYYFDVSDDDCFSTDDDGTELRDLYEARALAETLLPELARGAIPKGDYRDLTAFVRCQENRIRIQTTLSMRSVWVEAPDYPPPG